MYIFLLFFNLNKIYLYIDYIIIINMKTIIIGQIQKVKLINRVNFINTKWYSFLKKKKGKWTNFSFNI